MRPLRYKAALIAHCRSPEPSHGSLRQEPIFCLLHFHRSTRTSPNPPSCPRNPDSFSSNSLRRVRCMHGCCGGIPHKEPFHARSGWDFEVGARLLRSTGLPGCCCCRARNGQLPDAELPAHQQNQMLASANYQATMSSLRLSAASSSGKCIHAPHGYQRRSPSQCTAGLQQIPSFFTEI